MLLGVQVPSNLKYRCQVDLAQVELPARQKCSLQKGRGRRLSPGITFPGR